MKRIICVGGDLAAGKSTLTERLTKELGILCINKDTVKEILGDSFGFANREENLHLSRVTFSLMYYIARKCVEAGVSVILESNFRQKELDILTRLAENNGYEMRSLVVRADIEELYRRYNNRIENEGRHPVHTAVPYPTIESFAEMINEWREINYPAPVHIVDSTDFERLYNESLAEILEFLGE